MNRMSFTRGILSGVGSTSFLKPTEFRSADGRTGFSLAASAADPFGATATLPVDVLVGNRPPVVRTTVQHLSVPHRYDVGRAAWIAAAAPSSFEDPDGDPLLPVGATGDPACRTLDLVDGAGQVECALAYTPASGLPPLASFVGNHQVAVVASDGWSTATGSTTLSILNGSPSPEPFVGTVESCYCECKKWSGDGTICLTGFKEAINHAVVPLPVLVSEPEGDPLQVTFSGATPLGGAQKTVLPWASGAMLVNQALPVTVQISLHDGVAEAQTSSTVTGLTCSYAGQPCDP
jgi:hypothetical protein